MNRRHDIDNLRIICIFLLMVYHTLIVFTGFATQLDFPQNDVPITWVPTVMSLLNIWRIPLLIFVSGMGLYFAFQRRNPLELIKERSRRILVPLLFGVAVIVPLNFLMFQHISGQPYAYMPALAHLWFMANIMLYVIVGLPLFQFLKSHAGSPVWKTIGERLDRYPALVLIPGLVYVAESLVLPKDWLYVMYAVSLHGLLLGLVAFVTGFLIMMIGDPFWKALDRMKGFLLAFALVLHLVPFVTSGAPQGIALHLIQAIESYCWVMGIFGSAFTYLNMSTGLTRYLSKSVLPMYIIHMTMIYASSLLILPLAIPALMKLLLISILTTLGCLAAYEWVIKRVPALHPLFGIIQV
jgi:hypothetical protein